MDKLRNLGILLILAVALTLSAINVPTIRAAELTTEDNALDFLENVISLDIKRYKVTLEIFPENYSTYLENLYLENVRCTLESNESKIRVGFTFQNYTLTYCKLSILEGSILYAQSPSTNVVERADVFLQRYQNYLGTSDSQEMRDILATVDEVQNATVIVDNVRFELTAELSRTKLRWDYTLDGADYTKLSFTFRNNGEFSFSDTTNLYEIGSTNVKISKEEAVALAMERVENMSWTVEDVKVGNVSILDNRTSAILLTAPKEPLVLYPYWQVSLTFDKVYPGNVYGVTYNIWADTGEIFYGHMHMFGGEIPEFPTWTPLLLALCTVAVALLVYKQKLHKNQLIWK
jgi:hypothetical protein